MVGEDGRVWIFGDSTILGFDSGWVAVLDGYPYEPDTSLLVRGDDCGPEDTGCPAWIDPPRLAPESLIYALETAPEGEGGRITVINRDGSVRSGWPKTLQREGAPGTASQSGRTGSRTPLRSNPSRATNPPPRSSRSRPTARASG